MNLSFVFGDIINAIFRLSLLIFFFVFLVTSIFTFYFNKINRATIKTTKTNKQKKNKQRKTKNEIENIPKNKAEIHCVAKHYV